MPRAVIPVLKFIGIFSLGLLTGISYSNALLATPALLRLPNASNAHQSAESLANSSRTHGTFLLLTSISSYCLAYALSPSRQGRHPYLLWTSLVTAAGWGTSYVISTRYAARTNVLTAKVQSHKVDREDDDYIDATHSTANLTPTSGSAGSDNGFGLHDDAQLHVNGEQIRQSIEAFATVEGVRGGITGLAFLMATVGVWGDGVGVRRG